jgi:hypothetical protein
MPGGTEGPEIAALARIEHPMLHTVLERTEYIAELMARRVWNQKTGRRLKHDLARKWGITEGGVRNYAAEASRVLSGELRERCAELADAALNTLWTVAVKGRSSDIPGDKMAAVNASKAILDYAGIDRPDKQQTQPSTVVQVAITSPGHALTSPAMKGLVGKRVVNADQTEAAHFDELPASCADDAVEK